MTSQIDLAQASQMQARKRRLLSILMDSPLYWRSTLRSRLNLLKDMLFLYTAF